MIRGKLVHSLALNIQIINLFKKEPERLENGRGQPSEERETDEEEIAEKKSPK